MKTIKTKKFLLRPLRMEDAAEISKKLNDPIFARNTATIPYPYNLADAKSWVKQTIKKLSEEPDSKALFMIEVDGELAGNISLDDIVLGHKAEIGYWLAREFWGRGIMTEAVKKVSAFGFRQYKLKRIYATVYKHNPASMKVLTKAGYNFEGIERKGAKKKNKYIDRHIFALVK